MKYYEENSAAMSEDDDNVDIESDVSGFSTKIKIFFNSRDFNEILLLDIFSRTETT